MAARQRGDVTRTVILAHQVAAMIGYSNSKAGLKSLETYLKPIERTRKRRAGPKKDDFDALVRALERKARKQAKQATEASKSDEKGD